ncbi:hypothetical protein ACFQ6C_26690 [Streptomyces sp. NPDC056454]|uniref:hypothetical protein n=1 Tax=Streptomyces sp. NPDC056454 TaxID=3345823 RepID=UPI00367707E8
MATRLTDKMIETLLNAITRPSYTEDGTTVYQVQGNLGTLKALATRGKVEKASRSVTTPGINDGCPHWSTASWLTEDGVTFLREALAYVMALPGDERPAVYGEWLDSARNVRAAARFLDPAETVPAPAADTPRMVATVCSCGADAVKPLNGPRPACNHNGETRPNGGIVLAGTVVRPVTPGTCDTDRHTLYDVARWQSGNYVARCGECVADHLGVTVDALPVREITAERAENDRALSVMTARAREDKAREDALYAKYRSESVADAPTAPEPHGYTWADAQEIKARDLKPGDVFVKPGTGTAWTTATDGTVRGAGIAHAMELDGTAWTVVSRTADTATCTSHTGQTLTDAPMPDASRVLRVHQAPAPAPVLTREPWRGGQYCGHQTAYGMPGSEFCGAFKAPGLRLCQQHNDETGEEISRWAPGNAMGLILTNPSMGRWSVRTADGELCASADDRAELERTYGFTLLWEGETGEPVEPTEEERAAHAHVNAHTAAENMLSTMSTALYSVRLANTETVTEHTEPMGVAAIQLAHMIRMGVTPRWTSETELTTSFGDHVLTIRPATEGDDDTEETGDRGHRFALRFTGEREPFDSYEDASDATDALETVVLRHIQDAGDEGCDGCGPDTTDHGYWIEDRATVDDTVPLDEMGTDDLLTVLRENVADIPKGSVFAEAWERLDRILTDGGPACLPAPWDATDPVTFESGYVAPGSTA